MLAHKTLAAAAAAIALAGGAVAIPALAQDSTPAPQDEATTDDRGARHAERQAAFAEALAEELDLPVADVQAALEAVRERFQEEHGAERIERLTQRLDAAVADGSLTQEQADAILEAAEAGVLPGPGRHGPHHRPFRPAGPTADAA